MDLMTDPSLPPGRSSSPCKELIHWYFLFLPTSRILLSWGDYFPGPIQVPVLIARPSCGGMVLCLPILPAVLIPSISAASAAPDAVLFTA